MNIYTTTLFLFVFISSTNTLLSQQIEKKLSLDVINSNTNKIKGRAFIGDKVTIELDGAKNSKIKRRRISGIDESSLYLDSVAYPIDRVSKLYVSDPKPFRMYSGIVSIVVGTWIFDIASKLDGKRIEPGTLKWVQFGLRIIATASVGGGAVGVIDGATHKKKYKIKGKYLLKAGS